MAKTPAKKPTGSSKLSDAADARGSAERKAPKTTARSADSAPAAAPSAKPATAAAKAPAASGSPMFNTSMAANAAAALVGRKLSLNQTGAAKKNSQSFKHLKDQVAKPHVKALGGILDPSAGPKKTNQNTHTNNQVTRNQTYGADVTRSGVPRRNAG